MKIKILHVLDSLNVGGLENGLVNLINHSDPERFSHSVCCLREIGPMRGRIRNPNVQVGCIARKKSDYLIPWSLGKYMKAHRPHIVHTRNWGTIDGIWAARLAGVRHVIHGEHGREAADPEALSMKRNLLRGLFLKSADHIVSVSGEIRHWLIERIGISPGKITVIRNGVDVERFCPSVDKSGEKLSLGFEPQTALVGAVGRLDPVKNYEMLLKAVALLSNTGIPVKVVILGDGPERAHLEQFAREHNLSNVHFMGRIDNVQDYLKAFDLFVQTSLVEGISNTILEAMASGTPVVATRVGGNPEIIQDGKTGALIESGDHFALSEQMIEYLMNPDKRASIGRAAREQCEKRHSIASMVAAYEQLYTRDLRKSVQDWSTSYKHSEKVS